MNTLPTTRRRDRLARNSLIAAVATAATLAAVTGTLAEAAEPGAQKPQASPANPARPTAQQARGSYLVATSGCGDCHTPWKLGEKGPEPDLTRPYAGHPEQLLMPPAPVLPEGPWLMSTAATNTAWAGPWGVSFTANLTPDRDTGLGRWTEADFIQTIRTGRHMGRGRAVLPPMPMGAYKHFTDGDLKAIFAYLRTLPPVRNKVPDPVPPKTPMTPVAAAPNPR